MNWKIKSDKKIYYCLANRNRWKMHYEIKILELNSLNIIAISTTANSINLNPN